MTFYDFRCRDCGEISELFLRHKNLAEAVCPACGGSNMEKLLSTFNTAGKYRRPHGLTCCGREDRCETPHCDSGGCRSS